MTEALVGLFVMVALSFIRVPIAFSMGLVGFLGLWWMRGVGPSMASATTVVYESGFQYTLSVVPLFILMGNFVTRAGMSKELYRAAYTFVGHLRGGLAMASVAACGFGYSTIKTVPPVYFAEAASVPAENSIASSTGRSPSASRIP